MTKDKYEFICPKCDAPPPHFSFGGPYSNTLACGICGTPGPLYIDIDNYPVETWKKRKVEK